MSDLRVAASVMARSPLLAVEALTLASRPEACPGELCYQCRPARNISLIAGHRNSDHAKISPGCPRPPDHRGTAGGRAAEQRGTRRPGGALAVAMPATGQAARTRGL